MDDINKSKEEGKMNQQYDIWDDEALRWEEIETEHIVQDKWIDFRRVKYRMPDGREWTPFYNFSRRDYAVIIARDRQGRYITGRAAISVSVSSGTESVNAPPNFRQAESKEAAAMTTLLLQNRKYRRKTRWIRPGGN